MFVNMCKITLLAIENVKATQCQVRGQNMKCSLGKIVPI